MSKIDELTGNKFESEKYMYMRYHGFSEEEANQILNTKTHLERDEVFEMIFKKKREQSGNTNS